MSGMKYYPGDIVLSTIDYYDLNSNKRKFKNRPCMVVGVSDERGDYVVLPISTITKKENIDPNYDIKVDMSDFPDLFLNNDSYVRTHKQMVVHRGSI